jgi:hypothetical protein
MLLRIWYQASTTISSTSSDERASRMSKHINSARDEDKNVQRSGSKREELEQGATPSTLGSLDQY